MNFRPKYRFLAVEPVVFLLNGCFRPAICSPSLSTGRYWRHGVTGGGDARGITEGKWGDLQMSLSRGIRELCATAAVLIWCGCLEAVHADAIATDRVIAALASDGMNSRLVHHDSSGCGDATAVGPTRDGDEFRRVATQNQCCKAAYYHHMLNVGTGCCSIHGDGSVFVPTTGVAVWNEPVSSDPTGNFAELLGGAMWNGMQGNVADVATGGAASYYGGFDTSGILRHWSVLAGTGGSLVRR